MSQTDRDLLERLLDSVSLKDAERAAFSDMRAKLQTGTDHLSKSQRSWAERRYQDLELDADEPAQNLFSNGYVKASENIGSFDFERMPRPLKPPGRK